MGIQHENGDWQWAKYEYVKSGSRITANQFLTMPEGLTMNLFLITLVLLRNISYTAFEKNIRQL